MFGVIGGSVTFAVLIYLCVICCQRASGANKTSGVVYNAPTRNTPGVVLSTRNRSAGVVSNANKTKTNTELTDCPPPYSTIDKPIYNVQNEMKTTEFNGSLQNYGYLPQTEVRAPSAPKVHTSPTRKSHNTFMV